MSATTTAAAAAIETVASELMAAHASYNGYGHIAPVGLYGHLAQALAAKQLLNVEKDTHDAGQPVADESTPLRVYLSAGPGRPGPMGWYTTEAAARQHCEAALSAEHPASVALLFDWIGEDDDPEEPRELVATINGQEHPTGYVVHVVTPDEVYDPEADW